MQRAGRSAGSRSALRDRWSDRPEASARAEAASLRRLGWRRAGKTFARTGVTTGRIRRDPAELVVASSAARGREVRPFARSLMGLPTLKRRGRNGSSARQSARGLRAGPERVPLDRNRAAEADGFGETRTQRNNCSPFSV